MSWHKWLGKLHFLFIYNPRELSILTFKEIFKRKCVLLLWTDLIRFAKIIMAYVL